MLVPALSKAVIVIRTGGFMPMRLFIMDRTFSSMFSASPSSGIPHNFFYVYIRSPGVLFTNLQRFNFRFEAFNLFLF